MKDKIKEKAKEAFEEKYPIHSRILKDWCIDLMADFHLSQTEQPSEGEIKEEAIKWYIRNKNSHKLITITDVQMMLVAFAQHLTLSGGEKCKVCDGEGNDPVRPKEKCPWCYGDGKQSPQAETEKPSEVSDEEIDIHDEIIQELNCQMSRVDLDDCQQDNIREMLNDFLSERLAKWLQSHQAPQLTEEKVKIGVDIDGDGNPFCTHCGSTLQAD